MNSNWNVIKVSAKDWVEKFSENFHKLVFKEIKPAARDRISYALLITKGEQAVAYVTVRELDDENVYWQFGGVVPASRKSMTAVKAYELAIEWQRKHSKRILLYVENTNMPMLKLAVGYGFRIVGTRTFFDRVMVDFVKELHQ